MARTPGRRTDEPSEGEERATSPIGFSEVGMRLSELARQLELVAAHIDDRKFRARMDLASEVGDPDLEADVVREIDERMQRTLMGMQTFRRNYDYWERAIAEYALRRGMTQREAAHYLGVSTATINRWAQHPVTGQE